MIRVASWNVHGFVDATGRFSPEPALRVLDGLGADLVALQEVEDRRFEGRDALEWLAERGGWHAWTGPTLMRGHARYGNAVLSRRPAAEVRRHDLSVSGTEPRGLLELSFDFPAVSLRLLATHLGLRRRERRHQVRRLLELAGDPGPGRVDVLAGDLNEWLPRSGILARLRQAFPDMTRAASFPAHRPVLGLDRIFARPAGALSAFETRRLGGGESDHLPLIAVIRPDVVAETSAIAAAAPRRAD